MTPLEQLAQVLAVHELTVAHIVEALQLAEPDGVPWWERDGNEHPIPNPGDE